MQLTESNYYSKEADQEYISVSQYKNFVGTMGRAGCEARAIAMLKGEWVEEPTTPMLVGSYVDTYFEGTLENFKEKHPDLFTKKGELKSEYKKAEDVIARIEKDEFFKFCMAGKKQVILTAELFGAKWKGKIDSYRTRDGIIPCIVDLKCVKNIHEKFYIKDLGQYVSFVEYWGYDLQGAIYRLLEQATYGGEALPFLIAAADKTNTPDIAVVSFSKNDFDKALIGIEANVKRILDLKAGKVEPVRCEKCDFCKSTKVLTGPISTEDLIEGF